MKKGRGFLYINFPIFELLYNQQIKNISQSMGILSNLRNLIKMGDFFNASQLLRFQKQTQYQTFTGGLVSIGIIITIIIAFASMIIDTVNRTTISFTHSEQRGSVPLLSEIIASPDNNFMFAVEVQGYNLSSEYRYFDVLFEQIQSSYGANYVYTNYSLEPCTKEHWRMLPTVVSTFESIKAGNWLCPTIGTIIKLQGKFSSENYNQFSVTLFPCSNSTDPSRPCAPKQEVDAYVLSNGQWNYFNFYYVNSIINPEEPEYKKYYLQDRNYIPFSATLGAELDMYLSEIQITSDNSIWPFEDNSKDSIFHIPFGPILYPLSIGDQSCYATFFVMKDSSNEFYVRQVQKIFVVLSFMGGLIGAIMASLFIINTYTSFAYEIALATEVFKDNSQTQNHRQLKQASHGSVSIYHFAQFYFYELIKKFKKNINWPFVEYLKECREEIIHQLDVKGLIKRIIFLQYATTYILQDYHLYEMQKEKPLLPSQIKTLREKIDGQQEGAKIETDSVESNKGLQKDSENTIQRNANQIVNIDTNMAHQQNYEASNVRIEDMMRPNVDQHHRHRFRSFQNIAKIKESAKNGNLISRKLLNIIQKPTERSQTFKSIENSLNNVHLMNKR